MISESRPTRLTRAISLAERLHRGQVRKATQIPYISHLFAAAALTMEYGGDEDQAIAALLHDGPEDAGGVATLDEIRTQFGDRVADIVETCSDTFETPKPPWKQRKERYIAHLEGADDDALLVSAADKLHNATAMLEDFRRVGPELWDRFNASRDQQLWYLDSLAEVFGTRLSGDGAALAARLSGVIARLREESESR